MALFEHPDFDEHELINFHCDQKSGLRAIIAVHNTNLGPSLGGCRMYPYANSQEALTDVLRLSSSMSYKAAMAGLPQGGGKAVIIGDPRKDKSKQLMRAMGQFVDTLGGRYVIAEDSGISVEDLKLMSECTNYASGKEANYSYDGSFADGNPAPSTSYGVFNGIKAAVEHKYGTSLEGKSVAIQGIGHVGLRLARLLHKAGAVLYVSDIYQDNLLIAEAELGAKVVNNQSIHALDVDVFAPCALGAAINEKTVDEIKAGIVAGAANNQLSSPLMAKRLLDRHIIYVPDFVINAGGIIDIFHQSQANSSHDKLKKQLEGIAVSVTEILRKSEHENRPTEDVAKCLAEEKFRIQT